MSSSSKRAGMQAAATCTDYYVPRMCLFVIEEQNARCVSGIARLAAHAMSTAFSNHLFLITVLRQFLVAVATFVQHLDSLSLDMAT